MEYFGLEHWSPSQKESRTRQWINLRNRLTCDSSGSGIQLMLALRVKFWVPVHFILQESARNLFYMQAKVDLFEGRLSARNWTNAAKLAALMCQADGIRFSEASLKCECPMKIRKEQEKLRQQEQHQQQQQQQNAQCSHKTGKDKEHVLSFKKRRLSKQKSVENIENVHCQASTSYAANAATLASTSGLSLETVTAANSGGAVYSNETHTKVCNDSKTSSNSSNSTNTSSSSSSANTTNTSPAYDNETIEKLLLSSPLRIYEDYVIRPFNEQNSELPDDFLRQIAVEHGKLFTLKMPVKSAKYWLLQEIQDLVGYGEEIFSGVTANESSVRCDIAVGAHGVKVTTGDSINNIPFSAIAAAKSFRRTFKLEYVDDHSDRREIEIKLPKHAIAAGLYRSITERHAFYVCDKVRGVVTNQFTRDLKGTIASMFKEDTELGKRYVFDIQRTSREVHDQARRVLHERGIETSLQNETVTEDLGRLLPRLVTVVNDGNGIAAGYTSDDSASCSSGVSLDGALSMTSKLDLVIREKEEREAAIERCVDTRISEAMTCKICMDRAINTMFNPCCHVMACDQCAARCENCPNCRVNITNVVKIYLPPELRTHPSPITSESNHSTPTNNPQHQRSEGSKITTAT
uniref:RING-type domain-containing protein n=1 Tax=Glossina brevipalpis TaxID=37001 RepID=A0A1A9WN97_9MUSC